MCFADLIMEDMMASVTQRIKMIEQPHGGYLPLKLFDKECFDDGLVLNENENIHPSLIGLTVDYMTRFLSGDSIDKAFSVSIRGASRIKMEEKANNLKSKITGLDDISITSACKLVGFDVCYRSSIAAYKPIEEISPDVDTIENIRIMINRSCDFLKKYGPITHGAPTFEGGYTATVSKGDADFATKDTLWDFKVLRSTPNTKQTLQLLTYYVLGLHSKYKYFTQITKLGFYNPRLNIVYICHVDNISDETIAEIETKVVCYNIEQPQTSSEEIGIHQVKTDGENSSSHNFEQFKRKDIVYTVNDVYRATKRKKHLIYNDIHSGKLKAKTVGNKYVISEYEYHHYIERIKTENAILISVAIVLFIIFLFIISKLSA